MTDLSGLRAATPADANALLALIEADDIADLGAPDYTLEDVEDDLSRPTWQAWVAPGEGGQLRGMISVERISGRSDVTGSLVVHPDESPDLGDALLTELRTRAAHDWPELPVHMHAVASSTRKRDRLDAAGGRVLRHFWRMAITLADEPAPVVPVPAAGVTVEQPADERAELMTVHDVIQTAFDDHYGSSRSSYDEWIERQRRGAGADLGLWWLARVDGEPAGAIIGRAWPETGWLDRLGVLRAFRGYGLARLLLLTSFAEFHRRGYRTVSLGVDATNPSGAVALYESVGMKPRHEAVLYELDPPKDVSVQ